MGLTLGGGSGIQAGLHHLKRTSMEMDKSLQRISSGKKILSAADDAGGLMVAMNLENQINRTNSTLSTVQNTQSFVEMQASTLQSINELLERIQELVDYEKEHDSGSGVVSDSEIASYRSEFLDLQAQLIDLRDADFNGSKLFNRGDSITISTGSSSSVELDDITLATSPTGYPGSGFFYVTSATDLNTMESWETNDSDLTYAKEVIAGAIAQVAGHESVLGFAADYLSEMSLNMESAHGRIMDVNLAEETANYAALSMQQEAAAAAVAQANVNMKNAFDLLMSSINRD